MELRYLYIGSGDVEADLAVWLKLPGARLHWRFQHFGADVAAVEVEGRPFALLADHRPAGSVLPIYRTADLEQTTAALEADGWHIELGPVGTPEGPATLLHSDGGTTIALLRVDRPTAMEDAYAHPDNSHAVR